MLRRTFFSLPIFSYFMKNDLDLSGKEIGKSSLEESVIENSKEQVISFPIEERVIALEDAVLDWLKNETSEMITFRCKLIAKPYPEYGDYEYLYFYRKEVKTSYCANMDMVWTVAECSTYPYLISLKKGPVENGN